MRRQPPSACARWRSLAEPRSDTVTSVPPPSLSSSTVTTRAVREMGSVGVTDVTISAPPDVAGAQSLQRIIEARQALEAAGY